MDRNSSMEELHSFIKNYYQIRRGLCIITTKLMCNPFGYLGHNKLDHLAPMLLLSFISSSILFLSYASMPYSGIDYLLLSPLQPVIAISPPISIPGTTDNSNSSSIQPQTSNNDTAGTNASQLSPDLQIAYPRGWMANDLGNGTIRFSTPLRTDLMRFTVNVVNLPPSMENMTLDRLVDLNLNITNQQLSNFSLVETNTTTISPENQSAHKIIYTNTNKDPTFPLKFRTMQIFTIKDCQIFTISYVSEDSQYLRFLPTIERMIDSITFKKS